MEKIINLYRSNLLESELYGNIVIYHLDKKILFDTSNNQENWVYTRSVDKLVVVYCLYKLGLVEKYNLDEDDIAIMLSSHNSDLKSLRCINNLIAKLEIEIDKLVCRARIPLDSFTYSTAILKHDSILQKKFNSCLGNHIALLLLAREIGLDYNDYWKLNSPVQNLIYEILKNDFLIEDVKLGYDRCGVPNRYIRMRDFAKVFSYFSCKQTSYFNSIRNIMHKNRRIIDGNISLTNTLLSDSNIIAKAGADGIFAFGLKKEKIGTIVHANLRKEQLAYLVQSILKDFILYENNEIFNTLTKIANTFLYSDNGNKNIQMEVLFNAVR